MFERVEDQRAQEGTCKKVDGRSQGTESKSYLWGKKSGKANSKVSWTLHTLEWNGRAIHERWAQLRRW